MSRIDDCLAEYRQWCAKLGIVTVSDINKIINSGGKHELINISETWHEQKISEIAMNIRDNISTKKIVFISGPSSSGKTTFAAKLQIHLKVSGINAVSISLDNYYKPFSQMPPTEDGNPDYEALESIDYDMFNRNVKDLIEMKEIYLPEYDFKTSLRNDKAMKMKIEHDEVIIVEGIHGLNPKLTDNIPEKHKYRIYCSALSALKTDSGERIKSRSNRLIRRLIRDYYFRKAPYIETMELWANVEKGSEKNIYPYTDTADVIFNSSLLYENCVYKRFLHEVTADMPKDDPYVNDIRKLLSIVDGFEDIDKSDVPSMSFIREFVGGNTLYK